MTTFNAIIKKRNTDNTDWDSILPITTADNVLMNEQGETASDKFAEVYANKISTSKIVNTTAVTEAGFVPDALLVKTNAEAISTINNNLAVINVEMTPSTGITIGRLSSCYQIGKLVVINIRSLIIASSKAQSDILITFTLPSDFISNNMHATHNVYFMGKTLISNGTISPTTLNDIHMVIPLA